MTLVRRSARLSSPLSLPSEGWLVAGAAGATLCAVAALFSNPAAFLCAAAACLAAGAAFYEQRLIGPLLALALPLEITKLAFPFLQTRAELGGGLEPTSILDAGRLVVALAFLVWLIRPGRRRSDAVPTSPMTLPLALLFAVYAASVFWAHDPAGARTETLRLLFSLGGFALIPFFVRDRDSTRWTLAAVVASAAALAVVGVYQQITGDFLWNEGLGEFGERRINTTFADPNHFARFLVAVVVIGLLRWHITRRSDRPWLALALALSLLTLLFTGSRGAWIVALVALPLAVMALPVGRSARARVVGIGVGAVVVVGLALAAFSPFFTKRLDTVTFGTEAFGARPYLVEAGLAMFRDQPLTGVGAGGYQAAFEEDYSEYRDLNIKANITASHTSAITVLAELGTIGALAVLFVAVRWALYLRHLADTPDIEMRTITLGLGIATLVVLLGSQTEGRFLEDPYLWLFAGLVVAVDQIRHPRTSDAP